MKKLLLTLSLAATLISSVAMAQAPVSGPKTAVAGAAPAASQDEFVSAVSTLQSKGVFALGFRDKKDAEAAAHALHLPKHAIQKKSDIDYKLILLEKNSEAPASKRNCNYEPNGKCE